MGQAVFDGDGAEGAEQVEDEPSTIPGLPTVLDAAINGAPNWSSNFPGLGNPGTPINLANRSSLTSMMMTRT